jgi:DNA-directed RNA polymerase subunit RPC12/RpoP
MKCPVCKKAFPKFKEILIKVDRSFYCHRCWSRLFSYYDGKGVCKVEEDFTGKKWLNEKEKCLNAL